MAETCFVYGCNFTKGKTVSLHLLPKDLKIREKWVRFIWKNGYVPARLPEKTRVCSSHFQEHCFENLSQKQMGFASKLILKPDAVPSIYPGDTSSTSQQVGHPPKMFREMGCQTQVMTFDAECQTELSENGLQWQTSSSDAVQGHKKPYRRRKGSPSTLYCDCDWKPPIKMGHQSDCKAKLEQYKRSKHSVNTKLEDNVWISHDKMEINGGYEMSVHPEFDKEFESLDGQLQVEVEREEHHIQDSHQRCREIKAVKVKEEPDESPLSFTSNIHGVIEQAPSSPGHLKQEKEEPSAVTHYEDIVKVVVKQEDEKLILVQEDGISDFL